MAKNYKILLATHPILQTKAPPVASVNQEIQSLMTHMMSILVENKGVGLAAPQIGVSKRVLVMDIRHVQAEEPNVFYMANPEIIWASDHKIRDKEYCFSLPTIGVDVMRPAEVKVRYLDENNTSQELHAKDLLARCVQHEMDHLNGIATIDYLSPLRRKMAVKKLQRMEKYEEEE